jgi:4,5-dihydroxyphthalate decarboxylase
VRALRDGSVRSERVRFDFIEVDPITRAFRRMARDLEFDVSEMAITTHALAHAFQKPITALPIVLSRDFHHASVVCTNGSSIRGPKELAGRRVGVRAWSQTTGVWIRGIMKAEYGLEPSAMTTVTEEDAHVREYQDPPYVERAAAGKTLRGMLNDGEVDAAIALRPLPKPGEYRTVIPDADAAAAASAQAKLRTLVGEDTLPYGMARNRAGIEMLLKFAAEQTLTPRVYRPEELFDPGTLSS